MKFILPTIFFIAFIFFPKEAVSQGKNPCHKKKNAQGKGVLCEGVELPPSLCKSCSLKPTKNNGHFFNCKSIYNLNTPKCKSDLQKYVQKNPCDWKRKLQVQRNLPQDREGLDYFLYSICEQCCDCIKKGTMVTMFNKLKKGHTMDQPKLYTPNRGNCPSHAYFDVSLFQNILKLEIFRMKNYKPPNVFDYFM